MVHCLDCLAQVIKGGLNLGVLPILELLKVEEAVALTHLGDRVALVKQVKPVLEVRNELPIHVSWSLSAIEIPVLVE